MSLQGMKRTLNDVAKLKITLACTNICTSARWSCVALTSPRSVVQWRLSFLKLDDSPNCPSRVRGRSQQNDWLEGINMKRQ